MNHNLLRSVITILIFRACTEFMIKITIISQTKLIYCSDGSSIASRFIMSHYLTSEMNFYHDRQGETP